MTHLTDVALLRYIVNNSKDGAHLLLNKSHLLFITPKKIKLSKTTDHFPSLINTISKTITTKLSQIVFDDVLYFDVY